MPSWLTLKLGAMILGAAAILAFVLLAFHWKSTMTDRGEKLATICQATRDASGHKSLKCADVPDQIKFMGEAVTALSNSLKVQNAAVASLGAESERQKAEAAQASQKAEKRSQGAEATANRLIASSRSTVAQNGSCEPSRAVKESWQ
jgi:hypothetical protein